MKNRYVKGVGYFPGTKKINGIKYSAQHINSMHSQIQAFLAEHRGVSSKYLQGYLNLFAYSYSRGKTGMDAPDAYMDILKILVTPGYYLSEDELTEHFNKERSRFVNRAKVSQFLPTELEMYARYREGESPEDICKSLDCELQEFERAKTDIENTDDMPRLAEKWYRNEKKIIASEQRKQRERLGKEDRLEQMIRYRINDNLTNAEIAKIIGITAGTVSKIFEKARAEGYHIPKAEREDIEYRRDLAKRIYETNNYLSVKNPESTHRWRIEQIAKQTGEKKNKIAGILYRERRRRGEVNAIHVLTKNQWESLEADLESMIGDGMAKTAASRAVAKKYGISVVSVRKRMVQIDKWEEIPNSKERIDVARITAAIDAACRESFSGNPISKAQLYRLVAGKMGGISEDSVGAWIYYAKWAKNYELPQFNIKESNYGFSDKEIMEAIEEAGKESFEGNPIHVYELIHRASEKIGSSYTEANKWYRNAKETKDYRLPIFNHCISNPDKAGEIRNARFSTLFQTYLKRQQAAGYLPFEKSPVLLEVAREQGISIIIAKKIIESEKEKWQDTKAEEN